MATQLATSRTLAEFDENICQTELNPGADVRNSSGWYSVHGRTPNVLTRLSIGVERVLRVQPESLTVTGTVPHPAIADGLGHLVDALGTLRHQLQLVLIAGLTVGRVSPQ